MPETDVTQVSSPEPTNTSVEEVANPDVKVDLPLPTVGEQVVEEIDERGVPYKNVAHEYKRKFEDVQSELSKMRGVLENISQNQIQSQKQQEPNYTIADLEAYKQQHPEYAAWCEQEKARIQKEEIIRSVKEEFETRTQAQRNEIVKQQSLQAVVKSYPQAFKKDAQGNIIDWDSGNPLTQRIALYAKDPRISNSPDGILYAAKLAYADLANAGLIQAQTKVNAQKAEIADLHRRTAVEGGSMGQLQQTPMRVQALNRFKETGSRSDAREALKQMFVEGQ